MFPLQSYRSEKCVCLVLQVDTFHSIVVGVIVQSDDEVSPSMDPLHRKRSADIHVNERKQLSCTMTVVGIWHSWNFTQNAGDTFGVVAFVIPCHSQAILAS